DGSHEVGARAEQGRAHVGVAAPVLDRVADDEVAVRVHADAGVVLAPVGRGHLEVAGDPGAVGPEQGGRDVRIGLGEVEGPGDHEVAPGIHSHGRLVLVVAAAGNRADAANLVTGGIKDLGFDVMVEGAYLFDPGDHRTPAGSG